MIGQPPKGCVDNFSLETRWPDCLDEAGGRYAPLSPSRYCRPSIGRFPMCYGIQFADQPRNRNTTRSEEHTSELQSLMRISYAVFCLKKKKQNKQQKEQNQVNN